MANVLRSVEGDRSHEWDGPLEAMLSGQPRPANGDAELRGVDGLLAALRATTVDPVERRGQAGALEAFRETVATSHPSSPRRRGSAIPRSLLRTKLAVALAAGAVTFGGLAASAYTGVLPDGLQDLAHATVGAPAADRGNATDQVGAIDQSGAADQDENPDGVKETPVGPDATGRAGFGLCTAWANVQAQGKAADTSVAFRNLATAAGGVNEITAYCAKIPHPAPNAVVKPSTVPVKPSSAVVKPSSHPTGKPSTAPVKPSSHQSAKSEESR